jgi:hypothetical protein
LAIRSWKLVTSLKAALRFFRNFAVEGLRLQYVKPRMMTTMMAEIEMIVNAILPY